MGTPPIRSCRSGPGRQITVEAFMAIMAITLIVLIIRSNDLVMRAEALVWGYGLRSLGPAIRAVLL